MSELDLLTITDRVASGTYRDQVHVLRTDVPALIAEVEELRAQVEHAERDAALQRQLRLESAVAEREARGSRLDEAVRLQGLLDVEVARRSNAEFDLTAEREKVERLRAQVAAAGEVQAKMTAAHAQDLRTLAAEREKVRVLRDAVNAALSNDCEWWVECKAALAATEPAGEGMGT